MDTEPKSPDTPINPNLSNEFVSEIISKTSLPENNTHTRIAAHEDSANRVVDFGFLENFCDKFPQTKEGQIQYVLVKGLSRELLVNATQIEPIQPGITFNTKIKEKYQNTIPFPKHGDIDIVCLDKNIAEFFFSSRVFLTEYKVDADSSVRSLPAKLIGVTNHLEVLRSKLDENLLKKYLCVVEINSKKFIVPRPEVIFVEYSSQKPNTNELRWPNLLRTLEKRYIFDLAIITEALEKNRKQPS